jgi:hypothetical protein
MFDFISLFLRVSRQLYDFILWNERTSLNAQFHVRVSYTCNSIKLLHEVVIK